MNKTECYQKQINLIQNKLGKSEYTQSSTCLLSDYERTQLELELLRLQYNLFSWLEDLKYYNEA